MIIDGTIEAFMVGDTVHDIKIGKNVNIKPVENYIKSFLGLQIIKKNYIGKMPTVL